MDRHEVWHVVKKAGRMIGKATLWVAGTGAAIWIVGEGIRQNAEERENDERQKPPLLVQFSGREDTLTTSFMPTGPWQLSWTGALEIEIWRKGVEESSCHGHASGWNGFAFFPEAGEFYLVVRLVEPGSWHITIRSR